MPKTLNSLWEPPFPFPKGAEDIPRKGILAATPAILSALRASAPEPLGRLCSIFMLGGTGIFGGKEFFLAGPVLGAPMAVMALEVLCGGGAESVIFAGFAGSLSPALAPGDLFVPDRALSSEGTSAHYPAEPTPDPRLFKALGDGAKGAVLGGAVWSTDGPLRETPAAREAYGALGALAVEMEVSALFAAARFRGVGLASALLITDSFLGGAWRDGFQEESHKEGLARLGPLAWGALGAA
jgi:uridine phosphorylase